VSEDPENTQAPAAEGVKGEPPKLRRRPFGVRKADVLAALEHRDTELGAREAELAELRQDIAALWLAFAQHDRMIRRALGQDDPAPAPASDGASAPPPGQQPARPETASPAPPGPAGEDAPAEPGPSAAAPQAQAADPAQAAAAADAAIGRQLSDLDDVLAAIELATQTLERTYVSDPAQGGTAAPQQGRPAGSDAAA
jgi:hypothetical protein